MSHSIGVAVGSGTRLAKAANNLLLLENNFCIIVGCHFQTKL